MVLQGGRTDCGLACLAMVAARYGLPASLPWLRASVPEGCDVTGLRGLAAVAERAGLTARPVRAELEDLRGLALPAILHWNLNHFVVLCAVSGDGAVIHDPAEGRRRIGPRALSEGFTGVALELSPGQDTERLRRGGLRAARVRLRDLVSHVPDLRGALGRVLSMSLALETVALLMPLGGQVVVDEVVVSGDLDLLETVCAGLFLLLALQCLISAMRGWAVALLGASVEYEWSASLHEHLLRLPRSWFEVRSTGDVLSRMGAVGAVRRSVTADLVQTLLDGVLAAGMLGMLALYGGRIALVACAATSLDAGLRAVLYRSFRERGQETILAEARQESHLVETLRGIQTIRMLGMGRLRARSWRDLVAASCNARVRMQRVELVARAGGEALFGIDRVAMLGLGAQAVMSGRMSVGMLVAFLAYRDQFARRVGGLVEGLFSLRLLGIQTERLSDVLLAAPGLDETDGSARDATPVGVSLRSVSFRHGPGQPDLFDGLDLDVAPGACVAIAGPSGCGKSTLVGLMAGLIEPCGGEVWLDAGDTRTPPAQARSRMAAVLQDDTLFAGTLAENICGFDEVPDALWMRSCARAAAIAADIERMPLGYATPVGDMGSGMSGGQRQRVLLARALYRRPGILFLDEATSHLDEDTEARVIAALSRMAMTRVMVAHRAETLRHADRVIHLGPASGTARLTALRDGAPAASRDRMPNVAATEMDGGSIAVARNASTTLSAATAGNAAPGDPR